MTDLELSKALRVKADKHPSSYLTVVCRQYLAERRWQASDRSRELFGEMYREAKRASELHDWTQR